MRIFLFIGKFINCTFIDDIIIRNSDHTINNSTGQDLC